MNRLKKMMNLPNGMLHRFAGVLLVVAMLMPAFGLGKAQGDQLNSVIPQLQPMMDLVAAAALFSGAEHLMEGQPMPAKFAHAFFSLGSSTGSSLQITPAMKGDAEAQRVYISRAFALSLEDAAGEMFLEQPVQGYTGVQYMTGTISEDGASVEVAATVYNAPKPIAEMTETEAADIQWMDQMAAFSFRKAEDAPNGWKLSGFSFTGDHLEANVDAYFSQNMIEYINDRLGFSLLIPAAFTADILMETEQGIQSVLPDESAALYARRLDNDQQRTKDDIVAAWKGERPDMEIEVNETTGLIKGVFVDQQGKTHVQLMLATPGYLYEAGLTYNQDQAKDFGLYAEYMTNSFSAVELGIG